MAKANGGTFKMQLGKWAEGVQSRMDALARQTCQEMASRVVNDTPVDTGFLRGAWQPAINQEPAAGAAVDIAAIVANMKAGDRFLMRNHAAYAMRIEFGFVGKDKLGREYNQKPRHFVTANVKAWPQIVKLVRAELRST